MLRSSRFTPLYAVALAVVLAAALATPAFAHRGGRDHGGKKAIGEIASFDGTTLTVSMVDGTTFAAPVAADVKIKVEHRGQKAHGKGHKKPSNGSLEDLAAGAKVLKMKVTCDEVDKIRIRRAPASTETEVSASNEDPLGDGTVEGPGGADDAGELPETSETEEDDACGSDDDAEEVEEVETEEGADGDTGDGSGDLLDGVTEVVEAPTA